MERLDTARSLSVKQIKEWGEILTGFECLNKYVVHDQDGRELFYAGEIPKNLFLRLFLKSARPFEIDILRKDLSRFLRLSRPFRFYFHEVHVFDERDQLIGRIKRCFSLLRRIYTIYNASGHEIIQLFGPILHPWTFEIRTNEQIVGKITKEWSGLAKEVFTAADNFGVLFPRQWDLSYKSLMLGAVFLIDFVHFERRNNS